MYEEVLYLISTLSFEKVVLNLECGMDFLSMLPQSTERLSLNSSF